MGVVKKIVLILSGILLIVVCSFYVDYRRIKVDNRYIPEFEAKVISAVKTADTISLQEMTPFNWDEVYYFHAYTPPKEMYEKTGARWTNCNTFVGYLFLNDFEKELVSDEFYALVFMDKGRVVCHYTGASDKFGFSAQTSGAIKKENAIFDVDSMQLSGGDGYPLLKLRESDKSNLPVTDTISVSQNTDETDSMFNIKVGNSYKINGQYLLKAEPVKVYGDTSSVSSTEKNEEYTVEETKGDFVRIKSGDKTGWIPAWYLSDNAKDIVDRKPYLMIIKDTTPLWLYPNEQEPDMYCFLSEGRVVQVAGTYKDWCRVNFMTLEASNWGDRWVKKADTIPYDPKYSKEGIVKEGATFYDEKFEVKDGYTSYVQINSGELINNGVIYYQFTGVGGFDGYIKKDDFIPNPFTAD